MVKANLLVVDDEKPLLGLLVRRLERLSYKVYAAESGIAALEILQQQDIDVLVTDFKMPGMNGLELISSAIEIHPLIQSIVVTGYSDLKTAIDVMGAGAFSYLTKPYDYDELHLTIQKGLEKRHLLQDIQNKQKQLDEYRQHLEVLVEKRTEALTEANRALEIEIEERKLLERSLREAKVVADNANKAKSEFLANMSHEIRTPMTSAIGLLNLVLGTELLPKQKKYLEMARISTVVMHNLLNDILDFSKIEAGKLNLEFISFNPKKVIESVIDLQHLQAEEKKIQLSSTIADDVPDVVIGDPNRLRQIILNLVSNAIKFTHYGEVVISCENSEEVSEGDPLYDKYSHLHISVKDDGIGIDKEKLVHIFEAFSQADSSTTREYGGAGLGLNICRKLVAMMGGRLWAISEPGKGSIFHFICKVVNDHAANATAEEPVFSQYPQFSEPPADRNLNILLVEDNISNQWVFQEMLTTQGYTVVCVADGMKALQEIEKTNFDLLLLDLQLPEMSGYEVVTAIRQHERKSGLEEEQFLPIIAMTGIIAEDSMKKCLDAGMNDFIAKPFTSGQLFSKIWKHIRLQSDSCQKDPTEKEKRVATGSFLAGEIFDQADALKKASGNRDIMIERIKTFVQITPGRMEKLQKNIEAGERSNLEREVHHLNELAREVGATNFADELFSLLMNLRKNQVVDVSQTEAMVTEFEKFHYEPNIRTLSGG